MPHDFSKPHNCDLVECQRKREAYLLGMADAYRKVAGSVCETCAAGHYPIGGVHSRGEGLPAWPCPAVKAWELLELVGVGS